MYKKTFEKKFNAVVAYMKENTEIVHLIKLLFGDNIDDQSLEEIISTIGLSFVVEGIGTYSDNCKLRANGKKGGYKIRNCLTKKGGNSHE